MINNTVIEGRLVYEPELRHVGNNQAICTNTIVCNYWSGAKNIAVFVDVVFWGKTAENVCTFLKKGDKVFVNGILTNNTYTNKDGIKVSKVQIQAKDVSFEIKKDRTNDNAQFDPSVHTDLGTVSDIEIEPEDLPFY